MSIDPDNYSLSEFTRLNNQVRNLKRSVTTANVIEEHWVREHRSTYHWDRLYKVTGDYNRELIEGVRSVLTVGLDPNPVTLRTKVRGDYHAHELIVYVGDKAKGFKAPQGSWNVDLFPALVVWLDEELKRKAWVDEGHAGALYGGAL